VSRRPGIAHGGQRKISVGREHVCGRVIAAALMGLFLTVVAVRLMDVRVQNIEHVDRGLFAVITDHGCINVAPEDIMRIERTYTKTAIAGTLVELDKIYTGKGFIYLSSLDKFADVGRQMINAVDYTGLPVWTLPGIDNGVSLTEVRRYNYAIGTPESLIPVLFFVLSLQYICLSVGALALVILIFPFRIDHRLRRAGIRSAELEYRGNEDSPLGSVAK